MRKWPVSVAIAMLLLSQVLFATKTQIVTNQKTVASMDSTVRKTENIYTDEKPNIVINNKQQEFVVKLKSNPTTGYSWFLRDYDDNLLVPLKHGTEDATGGLIGAPGYETFTFKVKATAFAVPQETSLRFVYMRPWSGIENSSQSVFHISIIGK